MTLKHASAKRRWQPSRPKRKRWASRSKTSLAPQRPAVPTRSRNTAIRMIPQRPGPGAVVSRNGSKTQSHLAESWKTCSSRSRQSDEQIVRGDRIHDHLLPCSQGVESGHSLQVRVHMLRQALADVHKLKCGFTHSSVCIKGSNPQKADFARSSPFPYSRRSSRMRRKPGESRQQSLPFLAASGRSTQIAVSAWFRML